MKHILRSSITFESRRMAGARSLWLADGMKHEQIGKPIIAIVNSFTQFAPGHTHLHDAGQIVKHEIEKYGCFAAEFDTIAIDDGIAMGHDGMLYSLPSREIIADSVEYMVNAHKADAMVCISNCDKITPGMLMAAMRLNIPTIFVSGGPMEAGVCGKEMVDLIDAMVRSADSSVSDAEVEKIEASACPTCGCCSGMFTANSMNCLTEAIGLALPGNGTVVATHRNRRELMKEAARQIVRNAFAYYDEGDKSVLPRSIASRQAFLNAMSLDIAMGGSTNTVLHLLAVAHEAEADFTMADIDALSKKVPCICKVAPNTGIYHIQDVNRAGGVVTIMKQLADADLVDTKLKRVDGMTLEEDEVIAIIGYGVQGPGQSQNLKDNGFNVIVGQRKSKTYDKAVADGWVPGKTLFDIEEACEKATIIEYLVSDAAQIAVWPTVMKHLTPGKALYFSHGFGITYCDRTGIVPPKDVDVIMVAPKGSGTSLRKLFLEGRGVNSSYAVYRDATGKALERTLALGIGIGSGYLFKTDFKREVYSDLTGERGTLMGAIQGLLLAQFETLREHGHTPSEAFNETVEELTQSLMPLFAEKGMDWMYANCSTTAQRGALDWMGPFHDATKPVFEKLYQSVASGHEAQISIDSNSKPGYREGLDNELKAMRESEMWRTGAAVRKLRPENVDFSNKEDK